MIFLLVYIIYYICMQNFVFYMHAKIFLYINTLRFYLSVCACVTDVGVAITNLRVVCRIITCVPAVTEMAINLSRDTKTLVGTLYSALQATRRMPLWTLAIALAKGKNTRLFGVLDQNKTRFSTYVSQRAESKVATVTTSD